MAMIQAQARIRYQLRQRFLFEAKGTFKRTEDDPSVLSLRRLCLLNIADNMNEVWVKDYADNYLDQYKFRYIMGPFNVLTGDLVEELLLLLCSRKQLFRAALHLLLVPQLRGLSLETCPVLVTPALCALIAARCQGLCSLDISGARKLPSKVLCETIHSLPALRSLSLAGVSCDRNVIQTVVHCCRSLKHLDVSRCHSLSPAALLSLGGVYPSSSSPSQSSISSSVVPSSLSPTPCPLPLKSLLAIYLGVGKQREDSIIVTAYLLLSLPCLERIAVEGLSRALYLIEHEEFSRADKFADREGVPRLEEVWRERMQGQDRARDIASGLKKDETEEKESMYLKDDESENGKFRDEESSNCPNQTDDKREGLSQTDLVLHLKDVQEFSSDSLESLGRLCPGIRSLAMNIDGFEHSSGRGQVTLLDLQTWAGQLQSISFHYLGPLADFLLPLQAVGSSLISLILEGVKTSPHTPLLEVIKACPRLRELHISPEPPVMPLDEAEDDQQDDEDLPQLPNLCSLKLSFFYENNPLKPVMSWMSLKKVLKCLLSGSPLLKDLSLVSLPCPLNCVLQDTLRIVNLHSPDAPPLPLGRLEHVDLLRTDVQVITVKSLMERSKRLKFVNLICCWKINHVDWVVLKKFRNVDIFWR